MEIKDVFEVLSKGVIISTNSKKYENFAKFLSIEENFEELDKAVAKLGFYLVGENGYFYLTKPVSKDDEEKFFSHQKDLILSLALLKKLFVHIDVGHKIKKSDFIVRIKSKFEEVKDISKVLFKSEDIIEISDKFFNLLERNGVIEGVTKDEYLVLNAMYYYLDIVEAIDE